MVMIPAKRGNEASYFTVEFDAMPGALESHSRSVMASVCTVVHHSRFRYVCRKAGVVAAIQQSCCSGRL